MDKPTAKKVLEALSCMEPPVGALDSLLSQESEEDWKKLSRSLSDIFKGHFEVMLFIINRFPELDPDSEGMNYYNDLKEKWKRIYESSLENDAT